MKARLGSSGVPSAVRHGGSIINPACTIFKKPNRRLTPRVAPQEGASMYACGHTCLCITAGIMRINADAFACKQIYLQSFGAVYISGRLFLCKFSVLLKIN